MSGISGIFFRDDQPVQRDDLSRMSDAMAHRGPDSREIWSDGAAGLGHLMLQTTPEALHEQLPYNHTESHLTITADARIDNRDDLISCLGLRSADEETITDSSIILAAYRKWGRNCARHLLGDFVAAIWDSVDKTMFCCRDHLGIKPFIYYLSDKIFVFASEVDGVRAMPLIPNRINEGRIADFLVTQLEGIDKTSTFYEEIYRLPPAHTLVVSKDRIEKTCYWKLDPDSELQLKSDEEYAERFKEIYTDAIAQRLRGNNVASMLSGGVDSSSIVGIARHLHQSATGNPFPVFSAVSSGNEVCRETRFINAVLKQGGLLSHTVSATDIPSLNKEISNVVKSIQEPFDAMVMIIAVYLLANKHGYKVILDGIDGDVVASLSPSYPAWFLQKGNWIQAFTAMKEQGKNYYQGYRSLSEIIKENFRTAFVPKILRRLKYKYMQANMLDSAIEKTIINRDFARRINLNKRLNLLRDHSYQGIGSTLIDQHIKTVSHPYLTVGIERYHRVAAICGVEPRHPLLDKRVVEFLVSMPWDQKVRSGWSKYLLRKTCENVLPREVCWRQGREHLGWEFASKWLAINFDEVNEVVKKMMTSSWDKVNISRLHDSIKLYSSHGTEDNEVDLLDAFHLAHWLNRQS